MKNREMEERRILDFVKKSAKTARTDPTDRDAYVGLVVMHDSIRRLDEEWPGFAFDMTREILALGEVALFYVLALSIELSNHQAQLEDIGEGVEFEHEGSKFVAVDVNVLRHATFAPHDE